MEKRIITISREFGRWIVGSSALKRVRRSLKVFHKL